MLLNKEDLQWLACAIDGEGSICGNNKRFQLTVYNTNYDFAKRAADLIGTKPYPIHYNIKGESKIIYSAYTSKKMTILKILSQVEPYLVIKMGNAREVIDSILKSYDITNIII
jgi:hypothetical protein